MAAEASRSVTKGVCAGDHNRSGTRTASTTTMPAGAELRADQTWKKIQQNTFTRWVNQQLRAADTSISDLESDLCDGIQLIRLAEVLSGRRLMRYNKSPTIRTQMLDNVSLALKFFQDEEAIKIVNIDSMHIVDRNLKLILGLIYTLIMHYSISKATLATGINGSASVSNVTDQCQKQEQSPKRRLLAWIKSRLPADVPVTNFTSDWNDGLALGALIDACAPGSCSDWRSWRPDDALENTRKAMQAADANLSIADLISPEELINPNVDEKSVMTYLSQFPQARQQAQGRLTGVDAAPMVGRKSQFAIDLARAGIWLPHVDVHNLHGDALPVEIRPNEAFPTRYDVSYTPEQVGIHKITVTALLTESPSTTSQKQSDTTADDLTKTPATVAMKIAEATVNAVPTPHLIGLRARTELGEEERFRVTNVADGRQLNVVVVGADGGEFEVTQLERVGNATVCRYRPTSIGLHSLNVFVDRRHIPGSPFPIRVVNKATDKVVVWGRGIHSEGTCAGDELPVHVDAYERPVTVSVTTKEGLLVPVSAKFSYLNSTPSSAKESRQKPGHCGKSDVRNRRQSFAYVPRSADTYRVEIQTPDGEHLGKSPYEVKVSPRNQSKVRALGPGIECGVKHRKSCFYIDTFGGANSLEFSIEGPNETQISCRDNGDSSAVVDYVPISSGLYVVNVLNNGDHIKDSPFVLIVDSDDDDFDENNDDKNNENYKSLKSNDKHHINSDSSLIASTPSPTSSHDGSSSSSSLASKSKKTSPLPSLNKSQLNVRVSGLDDEKEQVDGNEKAKDFHVGDPVVFIVEDTDSKKESSQLLDVIVYGPDFSLLPLSHSGKASKQSLRFVPEKSGKHVISVCKDGVAVKGWPHTITIKEPIDLSRLRVYGPGVGAENIFVDQRTSFTVDSQQIGCNAATVEVEISDPYGNQVDRITVNEQANPGLHIVGYTPRVAGSHQIHLFVEGKPTFDIKVEVENKKKLFENDATEASGHSSTNTLKGISDNLAEVGSAIEQHEQQQQLNILKRKKDFDEIEIGAAKGQQKNDALFSDPAIIRHRESDNNNESICGENWNLETQMPNEYREEQKLLNGAERCPIAIGLGHLNGAENVATAQADSSKTNQPRFYSSTLSSVLADPKTKEANGRVSKFLTASDSTLDYQTTHSTTTPTSSLSKTNGFNSNVAQPNNKNKYNVYDGAYLEQEKPHIVTDNYGQSPVDSCSMLSSNTSSIEKKRDEFPMESAIDSKAAQRTTPTNGDSKLSHTIAQYESTPTQLSVAEIPRTVVGHNASLYLKYPFGLRSDSSQQLSATPITTRLGAWIEAPDGRGPKRVPIEKTSGSAKSPVGDARVITNQYRVDFFPEVEGVHLITVCDEMQGGREIEGSPFHVAVSALGADDAHRVTAQGAGLMTGCVGRLETFRVTLPSPSQQQRDANNEGGEVSVTVDGPSRAEITLIKEDEHGGDSDKKERKNSDEDSSACRVEYRVDEPGLYNFDVRFNDARIAGSPFRVFIKPKDDKAEKSRPNHTEEDQRQKEHCFSPTMPTEGSSPYGGPAKYVRYEESGAKTVEIPSTKREPQQQEATVPLLSDRINELQKSPHEIDYGKSSKSASLSAESPTLKSLCGKPHRIAVRGTGLEMFEVGEIASFHIDTSNAGVDLLFVGVVTSHGPCDEVFVRHSGGGVYDVDYRIRNASTKALIIIKYGDRQIPGSPFTVYPRHTNIRSQ